MTFESTDAIFDESSTRMIRGSGFSRDVQPRVRRLDGASPREPVDEEPAAT